MRKETKAVLEAGHEWSNGCEGPCISDACSGGRRSPPPIDICYCLRDFLILMVASGCSNTGPLIGAIDVDSEVHLTQESQNVKNRD